SGLAHVEQAVTLGRALDLVSRVVRMRGVGIWATFLPGHPGSLLAVPALSEGRHARLPNGRSTSANFARIAHSHADWRPSRSTTPKEWRSSSEPRAALLEHFAKRTMSPVR